MVCLHNNDVLITEKFFFCIFIKVLHTDDNVVKMILTHMDPQKQLKHCMMHARPVVGAVTL